MQGDTSSLRMFVLWELQKSFCILGREFLWVHVCGILYFGEGMFCGCTCVGPNFVVTDDKILLRKGRG